MRRPEKTRSIPALGTVEFGDFSSVEPVSRAFGGDRGQPVDRHYIEGFLGRHAGDIKGRVAEVGDSVYTHRFGSGRVSRSDIIDSPASANPNATVLVDLQKGDGVAADCFDTIILTQTLHMIYDIRGALATIHRALAPGGIVLATVPGITSIDAHDGPEKWFWAMTQTAARRLFEEWFGEAGVQVEQFGNVLAATAFLQGLAVEDVDRASLDLVDPLYPVITGIRARKIGTRDNGMQRQASRKQRVKLRSLRLGWPGTGSWSPLKTALKTPQHLLSGDRGSQVLWLLKFGNCGCRTPAVSVSRASDLRGCAAAIARLRCLGATTTLSPFYGVAEGCLTAIPMQQVSIRQISIC